MTTLNIAPVTDANYHAVSALQVAPSQRAFIEPNEQSLTEVSSAPQFEWHPLALLQDDVVVGFAMIGAYNAEQGYIWLDRFMIDVHFQHQGLGKLFLPKLCNWITNHWPVRDIVLSYDQTNQVAARLYAEHGFSVVPNMLDGTDTMAVLHVRL